MKKLKTYCVLVISLCTIAFISIIGLTSILTAVDIIEKASFRELRLKASNSSLEFDSTLSSIEQCVDTLALAATSHIEDFEQFKSDDAYVDEYTKELTSLILYSADNTQGAISIYMRFNPEFTSPTSGLFYVRSEETGKFEEFPVTDFSKYSGADTIWYDVPVANGKPTWMMPYDNNYIDKVLISYVVPYYIDGELVGIIGMDIDCAYIENMVNSIQVYDTGFAFLADGNGHVIVHKDYELYDPLASDDVVKNVKATSSIEAGQRAYIHNDVTYVYAPIRNGMTLCINAPNDEIYAASKRLTTTIIILECVAFLAITIISSYIIRKLLRLSEIDELTGIFNRKYFIRYYQDMKKDSLANYSLFIFDIDKFKSINDTYGHNAGDSAIKDTAVIAKDIIGSMGIIARWGGDEFIGLIQKEMSKDILERICKSIEIKDSNVYGKLTLSLGYTDIDTTLSFSDNCEKADQGLYESKTSGRNRVTKK